MKYFISYTLPLTAVLAIVFFQACKKDEPSSQTSDIKIAFENVASGQPLEYGKLQYENMFGNRYSVNTLKYYVSHITLETADGQQHALNNYDLINQDDLEISEIQADSIPHGRYVSMKFNVGIDSIRNHSGDQAGDLDPSFGMVWSWTTGYIFYRHEGNYINSLGDTTHLFFHLGTDPAMAEVSIPLDGLDIDGTTGKIVIRLDLNELYRDIDFEENGVEHSSTDDKEVGWIALMREGLQRSFSFDRVE